MLTDIYNLLDGANIIMLFIYCFTALIKPMNTLNRDVLILITFFQAIRLFTYLRILKPTRLFIRMFT